MMMDKNGREIRTGDVVRISNAYFKNDNGLYFVEHSPGDVSWSGNDYCLHGICRNGRLSKACRIAFWPLQSFVSDREKTAMARDWNREHAEIEIDDSIDRSAVREWFAGKAESLAERLEKLRWNWGKHSNPYVNDDKIRLHYLSVADRLA